MTHKLPQLLTLILTCLLSPVSLLAHDFEATNSDGITIYYNKLSDTECAVTYYGSDYSSTAYSGAITIPASVFYAGTTYSVTSIDDYAFMRCASLSSIALPNSITAIGRNAFRDCTTLTSISLPNSISSIGDFALYNCISLSSITLPNAISSIGKNAFWCCESLTSVTLPNSLTTIGSGAFSQCI